MIYRLLPALLALWPACAQAQAWATRAACDVQAAEIQPDILPDQQLAALRASAAEVANGTGRFWRIQSPDGAVSHLWGSYPSAHPLILELPQITETRIRSARLIAVDSDPVAASRAEIERHLPPQPISNAQLVDLGQLPTRAQTWINARAAGLGLPDDAAALMSAGALAEMLVRGPCDDFTAGVIPQQSTYIQTLGLASGADRQGLEAANTLAEALDRPDSSATAQAVLTVLAARQQPQTDPGHRAARFALYREGAIATLMEWERVQLAQLYGAERAAQDLKLARKLLLEDRNAAFLKRALPELREGGVFMALGAFHLPGETGMIALLQQAGFSVSRIPLTGEPAD